MNTPDHHIFVLREFVQIPGDPKWPKVVLGPNDPKRIPKSAQGHENDVERRPKESNKLQNKTICTNTIYANSRSTAMQLPAGNSNHMSNNDENHKRDDVSTNSNATNDNDLNK